MVVCKVAKIVDRVDAAQVSRPRAAAPARDFAARRQCSTSWSSCTLPLWTCDTSDSLLLSQLEAAEPRGSADQAHDVAQPGRRRLSSDLHSHPPLVSRCFARQVEDFHFARTHRPRKSDTQVKNKTVAGAVLSPFGRGASTVLHLSPVLPTSANFMLVALLGSTNFVTSLRVFQWRLACSVTCIFHLCIAASFWSLVNVDQGVGLTVHLTVRCSSTCKQRYRCFVIANPISRANNTTRRARLSSLLSSSGERWDRCKCCQGKNTVSTHREKRTETRSSAARQIPIRAQSAGKGETFSVDDTCGCPENVFAS